MGKCVWARNCGDNIWFCPFVGCKRECPIFKDNELELKQNKLKMEQVKLENFNPENIDVRKVNEVYAKLAAKGLHNDAIASALGVPLDWLIDALVKRKVGAKGKNRCQQRLYRHK